jgi:hypothetical protein
MEREREREKEGERELLFLFLKGMTGALAPFCYLVFDNSFIVFRNITQVQHKISNA